MRGTNLTDKEQRILNYITDNIEKNGYSPSVRDIKNDLGIPSTSTVHSYIERLEQKGFIHKEDGKSRTLRVGPDTGAASEGTLKIPLIGRVAAGQPIFASENYEGMISFPADRARYTSRNLFALRVAGKSMIEAGIMDGDVVIVEKTAVAENGDIIVALIEDEATVKTFYRERGHFRLQPENSTMAPIIANELTVLGRVIANVRYYD